MSNEEDPKRIAHTKEVLREIFARSGNICAFPGCSQLMILNDGKFVGQICHIEGVKGERFNKNMTNQERAAAANLMLMCYRHHVETDDVERYTVDRLKQMKQNHESLFSDPGLSIYKTYIDETTRHEPNKCRSANYFCKTLDWDITNSDNIETVNDINAIAEKLKNIDISSRRFISAVVNRAFRVQNTDNVSKRCDNLYLRWDDFSMSYQVSDDEIRSQLSHLEAHRLGGEDEMEINDYLHRAIRLNATPIEGWDFWLPLAEFCTKTGNSLEEIIVGLNFSILDCV